MSRLVMDEDLSSYKLLQILEAIDSQPEALSIPQIQRRLSQTRGLDLSRAEIEAHLKWGLLQPNATSNPVYPKKDYATGKWLVEDKSSPEEDVLESPVSPQVKDKLFLVKVYADGERIDTKRVEAKTWEEAQAKVDVKIPGRTIDYETVLA